MIVHSQQLAARAALLASVPTVGSEPAFHDALPPSERDFQIFERVAVEGASTRAVAEQFGLSQTRVVQIRDRTAEWIGSEVGESLRLDALQRLRLAAHIASQRIDYLYAEAMQAWRASQGTQTTARSGESGETTITRPSFGDVRYLSLAARIAERNFAAARRMAETMRKCEAFGEREASRESEEAREGEVPAEPPACAAGNGSPRPSVRDCSPNSDRANGRSTMPAPPADATACESAVLSEIERRRQAFLAALADDTSPVQPPRVDAGGLLIDKPEAGEEMALSAVLPLAAGGKLEAFAAADSSDESRPTPLTRCERKTRQRMLERKLAQRRAK
jgi:hypothetical protein